MAQQYWIATLMKNNNAVRRTTLSKKRYDIELDNIKSQHPWLSTHIFRPAPGHMSISCEFLVQLEKIIKEDDLRKLPLFFLLTVGDHLKIHIKLPNDCKITADAIRDLVTLTIQQATFSCSVCSSTAIMYSRRCHRHKESIGWFTNEISKNNRSRTHKLRGEVEAIQDAKNGAQNKGSPQDKIPPKIDFIDANQLCLFLSRDTNKEKKLNRQIIHDRICAAGNAHRLLGQLPCDWMHILDEFSTAFPNFHELSDILNDHFSLNSIGDNRILFPPILLLGEPGIGKTEAACWLAEHLLLPCRTIDMATEQTSASLSGLDTTWSNSAPGVIFELLAYQEKANPIVILDEIDKVRQDTRHDPLSSLYTLLEARSARNFVDLGIKDFSINASNINWIATANTQENIPKPLLSRFTTLTIKSPTSEQTAHIAQRILNRLCNESPWGASFSKKLDLETIERLQTLSPRDLTLVLRRALGKAARDKRCFIAKHDLPDAKFSYKRTIGFIPQ
jgi:ATP-dependent Lon protease